MIGLIGRKIGMTRLFDKDNYSSVPVTVVKIDSNRIVQSRKIQINRNKTTKAVQLTTGLKKKKLLKSQAGHFLKAGVKPGNIIRQFIISDDELTQSNTNNATDITVNFFENIKKVDITGVSKGKGFQGCVKRWNFRTQDATHGNSLSHRAPGSTGQCQTPGRVLKGKKMAGQMGNKQITTQNLKLVSIDKKRQILFLKGAVPGSNGKYVIVKPAVKVNK